MIRRPPRSTQGVSSAASDVYKRQGINAEYMGLTYGTYMIHLIIYYLIAIFSMQGEFYTDSRVYTYALGVFFISYIFSFFVSILIESPIVQLLKKFIETGNQAQKSLKQKENQ
eukprot:TRINITY_DN8863_c0_g2_i2.p2 TRINITY_DN8863_c0_g2~~TRINITY_DN8863_c0_g2_i2.p2  ORF type:complete len:113 (+),score=23.96 TRINITY_DN8863_c0_g2_i2:11-349(+)